MDLVTGLSQALGVNPQQAQALAGAALATVQGQVAEQGGEAQAAPIAAAVPELGGWLATAKSMMSGETAPAPAAPAAGGFGAALGFASSGLGNQLLGAVAGQQAQDAALFAGLLSKFGLDAQKAALAAPVVVDFLKSRLDPKVFEQIRAAAPFLTGGAPGAGGVASALGGLFGR